MIDQNPDGGSGPAPAETNLTEIPFPAPVQAARIFRPVANHILLKYDRPEKVGLIHMAPKQAPLDTLVAPVLAVGPDCKVVKPGDHILILTKALIGGQEGLLVYGTRLYLTQEQVVIAVLEQPPA